MTEQSSRLGLKYRLVFYFVGLAFAVGSYTLGLWIYGIESASWGDIEFYQRLVGNLLGAFMSHQLSFFGWILICTSLALAGGYLMDKEVFYRKQAERQANIDGLTGVYNHRFFQEHLAVEIERATRYGRSLSVVMLDLDNFKHFNDSWGHQEGDKLLKWFASIAEQCVRNIDMLARYGGEEFVVVLPETQAEDAFNVAERIRANVEKQSPAIFGRNRAITISAGIASLPQHGVTRHTLILNADAALYHAKTAGKNRCCIFEEQHHRSYKATGHVTPLLYEDDMAAIEALSEVIDARDPNRAGHSHAVMQNAVALGQKLGLSPQELANLRVAALLHDIGSVVTPKGVLEKAGPLDAREVRNVESHAGLGSSVLKKVQQMAAIVPAVKHHHERFDGTGYPNGLSGKSIPLIARIIAIADAYDAMTSSRAYHDAVPPEKAVQEIVNCAGTQFDPELARAFAEIISRTDETTEATEAA